jgi:hypothetical protein
MTKIKLPSNEIILYALALAGSLNFMYALTALDGSSLLTLPGILSLLRGLTTGAVAGLAMAKISHAIPRASKANKPYLVWSFVAFLAATLPLISVVTFAKMSGDLALLPLWIRISVSIAAGVLLDALTAGVAFASGKLEADDKPESTATMPKIAKVKLEPVAEPAAPVVPVFACATCEREFATQNALNAHERSHKAKVVGYKVNFEEVKK